MINSWSIYDNSCSKNKSVDICVICGRIFVIFELFVFVNKNPCHLCNLWEKFVFEENGFDRTFLSSLDLNHVGQKTQSRRE